MKNKLFYNYVIDKRLPLLLGIKEEEITEVNDSSRITFKRNNILYNVRIFSSYSDKGISINLSKSYENNKGYTMFNNITLIELRNIQDDSGFEKFRNLLTESTKEPIKIDCDEKT